MLAFLQMKPHIQPDDETKVSLNWSFVILTQSIFFSTSHIQQLFPNVELSSININGQQAENYCVEPGMSKIEKVGISENSDKVWGLV